ncbi:M28 family peptidase [Streptomyces carpaticus]|uniref:M28 family peptidase n=1 Tax=Streptomyces carpaticus TaxID=285558 RepID=A0ABV4ZMV7_9ACTN
MSLVRVGEHLEEFQRIALANHGHRASGTAGHAASLSYVEKELSAAGYLLQRQKFSFLYTETVEERMTLSDGRSPAVIAFGYAPSTPEAGLTAAFLPLDATGCHAADWAGVPAEGRTVVLPADGCAASVKERAAADAGAAALLLAGPGPDAPHGWLTDPEAARIPVGGIGAGTAGDLAAEAAAGRTGQLWLRSLTEPRTTENLIATTPAGDPARTVVAGAHLDSVPGGPGINDNGVAAAVLLEAALDAAPRAADPGRARLRFAFWAAEEFGLLGSAHYLDTLPAPEREATALYLNLEMIGSPNHGLYVLDPGPGDPASADIADRLTAAFAGLGETARPFPPDGRSDFAPFLDAGIPTGGLYGGSYEPKTEEQAQLWGGTAGVPHDPCYHLPCDDTSGYSRTAAALHGEAFHRVLEHYARHPLEPEARP